MELIQLPSGTVVNQDTIAWAENRSWRETTDGNVQERSGVAVHFVGGAQMRVVDEDADLLRSYLLLPRPR